MDTVMIGRRIQQARKKLGMTQHEMAQQLGLSTKYISNIECGFKNPHLETFVAIANTLEVDANTLLCDVLKVSGELRACELSGKISTLPPQKREMILQVLELLVKEN